MLVLSIVAIYAFLWISSYFFFLYARNFHPRPLPSKLDHCRKKNVLLVISHPDDESMFFSPTLLSLAALDEYHVRVLCLSIGNAEGLGPVRRTELLSSCSVLKIPAENVEIIDDPGLQDGFNEQWSRETVMQIVKRAINAYNINIVISFDRNGVSGHPNHCVAYYGICNLLLHLAKESEEHNCESIDAWELVSNNILLKYCGPMTVLQSILKRQHDCRSLIHHYYNQKPLLSFISLRQHASQWLWYRRLFIIFSSYTYVNALKRITICGSSPYNENCKMQALI